MKQYLELGKNKKKVEESVKRLVIGFVGRLNMEVVASLLHTAESKRVIEWNELAFYLFIFESL